MLSALGKLFRKIVFRGLPEGIAQFSTPVTTLCMNHTLMAAYGAKEDDDLKHYYRAGQLISVIGSALCVAVYVIFPHALCTLFGANAETIRFTEIHMWEYCWGFVIGSINTMLSAYFYSTKRSGQAIALNTVRSLVMNSLVITFLPKIFGAAIVWHTFGIYEILVLVVALILKKASERNEIIYK